MAVKTRWDQKTYRRHMFNRGRGVRSPHDTSNTKVGTAQVVDSQLGDSWWEASWRAPWAGKLNAAKEYEQYNNPDSAGWSPFTLDSTERERFRKQDRKEVRDLFQKQLSEHHFSKHKKLSPGQLDKIVDAYMSQDDDKFQATLVGMGFSDKDAGRVRRAAEESATAAIEGTAYGTKWDDDDYAKQSGAKPGTVAAGNQPSQAGQGGTVANGQPKAGQPAAAQPLTRRGAPKNEPVGTGMTGRRSTRAGYSDYSWDGGIIPKSNNAALANVAGIVAAETQAGRDRAEAAARVQHAVSSHADSEAYQASMNERERIEQIGKDRRARQAAEREAAAQRRADKRFADRTLYNEADWKNLGREGSNKADYSDRREGESDKDWAVRDKARQERQGRMDALLKRLDDMGVQDADKNSFYANDPNKQQNLARLRGLIVGDDGKVRGDITDAQIEGANATLDAWKKGADEKGARQKAFTDMKQAEEVSRLRNMYGMKYGVYSPQEVLDFHKSQQAAAQRNILEGMQVAPGLTPGAAKEDPAAKGLVDPAAPKTDMRPAAMAKFAQDWQKLIDNGFDPDATFKEAMNQGGMKDAHRAALATLDRNDPDYADKEDQLRRRFTLQYAMQKAGLGQEGGGETGQAGKQISAPQGPSIGERIQNAFLPEGMTPVNMSPDAQAKRTGAAMAQNLPGKSILAPTRGAAEAVADALQPRQPQQTPGVQVFNSAADAAQARDAANAAAGIPLKRKRSDGGMLS